MTTIIEETLHCPVCGTEFETSIVASTNQMGAHTDFRPVTMGVQAFFFFVHTCPECFFSANRETFDDEIDEHTKTEIRKEMLQWKEKLSLLEPSPAYKYLLAALCAEMMDLARTTIADLYLRGAWSAAEEQLSDLEEKMRRSAAERYIEGLARGEVDEEEEAQVTYLIGELLRRVGEVDEARKWFKKVESKVKDESEYWLVRSAKQQMTEPKEFFEEFLKGD